MDAWLLSVLTLVGTALLNGIVAFFLQRTVYKNAQKRDKLEEEKLAEQMKAQDELYKFRQQQERAERMEDIQTAIAPLEKKIDDISKKLADTSAGTLAGLRDEILTCYYRCHRKGYRNNYDTTNIHDLYEAYKALGGNSFVEDVIERFDNLPPKESIIPTAEDDNEDEDVSIPVKKRTPRKKKED